MQSLRTPAGSCFLCSLCESEVRQTAPPCVIVMRRLISLLWLLWLPVSLFGQMAQSGISVSSTADLNKTPEIVRLHLRQYARGADHDTAKSALIGAEKKLLSKLGEAGAEVVHATAAVAIPSGN